MKFLTAAQNVSEKGDGMAGNTYSFTIFLMKKYVTNFEWCIKEKTNVQRIQLRKESNLDGIIVVAQSSHKKPEWVTLLEDFGAKNLDIEDNTSNKAMLLVRINGRIMAVIFGYGRSLLREEYIEKNFGLLTAINMIDSEQIRSINASKIEDMIIHKQEQTAYATGQDEFSINTMSDIIMSVTGKSKNNVFAKNVSGKDSLLVSVETKPENLGLLLQYYLRAYQSENYKKIFPWIDNIQQIRDSEIKEKLEVELIKKLRNKDLRNIYIAPPETIDWNRTKGIAISGMRKRKNASENYGQDLNLEEYVNSFQENVRISEKIRKNKILLLDINDEYYNICSVYDGLVAQLTYENKLYILSYGNWYVIEQTFYEKVITAIKRIPLSSIELPECDQNENEGDYNEKVALGNANYTLVDKKLISVELGAKQIEACDIFTSNKQFIHVKNKHASSQLSHLFSQGKVSATCFISDQSFRKQLHNVVKSKLGDKVFDYKEKPNANEYEVIYAIISKNVGPIEENLPFFSLVNLMITVQELDKMHFKYSVKMIKKQACEENSVNT